VLGVAAEFQNVPLRDSYVLHQLPYRMPQAFDECSSLRFGKTIDGVHEVNVRTAAFQERDEVFAQRLVVIFRFAFLFRDALVFFLHESFLFLPNLEKQLPRRVRNRILCRFHETAFSNIFSYCKKVQASPSPFRPAGSLPS